MITSAWNQLSTNLTDARNYARLISTAEKDAGDRMAAIRASDVADAITELFSRFGFLQDQDTP